MIDVSFLRLFSVDIFSFDVYFSTYFVRRSFFRYFLFRRFQCNSNHYTRRAYFPTLSYGSSFHPSNWLHERLMTISNHYRYTYRREQQRRRDEELRRAQEEEYTNLRASFIEEETQYQRRQYENDFTLLWQPVTAASPSFIAQFRLAHRQTVTPDLLNEKCTICLDDFQLNQYYAQWSCSAKHTFHFDCMLDTLRVGNTCPLCRFPVEATNLFIRNVLFQQFFGGIIPNVFH